MSSESKVRKIIKNRTKNKDWAAGVGVYKEDDQSYSVLNDHHLLITRKSFGDYFANGKCHLGDGGV